MSTYHGGYLFGSPIQARGRGKLLSQFLVGLKSDDDWDEGDRALAVELLGELVDRAIGSSDVQPGAPAGRRIDAIRSWFMHELGRTDLTPDVLAREFGMSRRSLFRLFAENETTPRQWMLDLRLEAARLKLQCEGKSVSSISQLAFDVGFEDPGQFSKCFRRKFGITARELRR